MSYNKDKTSEDRSYYSFMKKIYNKTYSKPIYDSKSLKNEIFVDNSGYLLKKKSIAIGKPKITNFYTLNNKREIKQAKKRMRSSG
tara:strand:- start:7758 stop:8012 length:255 start_codon:yes stop_codon:yes gene_type:complete